MVIGRQLSADVWRKNFLNFLALSQLRSVSCQENDTPSLNVTGSIRIVSPELEEKVAAGSKEFPAPAGTKIAETSSITEAVNVMRFFIKIPFSKR
jgi:hypothetical protein